MERAKYEIDEAAGSDAWAPPKPLQMSAVKKELLALKVGALSLRRDAAMMSLKAEASGRGEERLDLKTFHTSDSASETCSKFAPKEHHENNAQKEQRQKGRAMSELGGSCSQRDERI